MADRQVAPHETFQSGDYLALVELRSLPDELSERHGLVFEERLDDLDRFDLAAIALDDGSQVWLLRYRGEQDAGTTMYVDARADLVTTKELVLRALRLDEGDLAWTSPLMPSAALA